MAGATVPRETLCARSPHQFEPQSLPNAIMDRLSTNSPLNDIEESVETADSSAANGALGQPKDDEPTCVVLSNSFCLHSDERVILG